MRGRGRAEKRFLHSVLAATNLAGGSGRTRRSGRFDGSRIGRGSGTGRMLATRGPNAMVYRRRVIIKSRIVRLAGKGMAGARAHVRYVERDGTTRDGGRGQLYGAENDHADGKAFLGRAEGDRHHFRFIVSAEDAAEYEDLKPLTRRLMARVEEDLGTRLDWVAVDHFNTGHPHTHIIVRGKDDRGKDLVISGGFNIYPKEIESEIDAMLGVVESAVIGVPHADFGEGVTAVLVRQPGASIDEAAVLKGLDGRLAKFKMPKRVFVVDELPRNTMGKVQKNILRETYKDIYAKK